VHYHLCYIPSPFYFNLIFFGFCPDQPWTLILLTQPGSTGMSHPTQPFNRQGLPM
jgi:hypothetical protein